MVIFHFEAPEVDATEALGHFSAVGLRAAFHIQPYVTKARGFHHQSVTLPMTNRLRIHVQLGDTQRQTVRIGTVFIVVVPACFTQPGRPRREWKAARDG